MTSAANQPTCMATAARLAPTVGHLGGAFMLDPAVLGPGKTAGYPGGFSYYVVGRGGVLGDVDASVVSSAFGFFAPGLIRSLWEAGVPVEGARAGADRYTEGCADWGRARLAGWSAAGRTAELLQRVVDSADDSGMALFAGWRAQSRPTDAVGRAYVLIHVLRELRGGAHLIATLAAGLSPLESVLVNPTSAGVEQAKRFGWTEPFPDTTGCGPAMNAAEAMTDALMARHLAVLTDDELDELATNVESARRIVFGD